METFLKIENFSCGYGDEYFKTDKLNLSIIKGSFTGIIGKNGSGKSTFFKGITGDIPSLSGSITLNEPSLGNINLLSLPIKKRAQIVAVVSQFAELAPISVKEYVLMGRTPYRKPLQFSYTKQDYLLAEKYMEMTGITHLKDKLVTELSGGEQQMINIACALTQQPLLLLLDEPTSHLDISFQLRIMDLLQQLNAEENLTIIMIIHDLNLAGEYCSNIALMKEGKIICQGTPDNVLTYNNIEYGYDTTAVVQSNPISGKPLVFPISKRCLEEHRKTHRTY
jgi:ABC-type cobalamin/Fe3+-siderophores transport systems, ATPase components